MENIWKTSREVGDKGGEASSMVKRLMPAGVLADLVMERLDSVMASVK